VHQIRYSLGLHPKPGWERSQHSPGFPIYLQVLLSKGKDGKGKRRKGVEREGKKRKGRRWEER